MVCDCQFDPGMRVAGLLWGSHDSSLGSHDPELDEVDDACGENCLNRLLMIEWYVRLCVQNIDSS